MYVYRSYWNYSKLSTECYFPRTKTCPIMLYSNIYFLLTRYISYLWFLNKHDQWPDDMDPGWLISECIFPNSIRGRATENYCSFERQRPKLNFITWKRYSICRVAVGNSVSNQSIFYGKLALVAQRHFIMRLCNFRFISSLSCYAINYLVSRSLIIISLFKYKAA